MQALIGSAVSSILLSACSLTVPGQFTPSGELADLIEGPPVETISTPFDTALACLGAGIDSDFSFSVGNVADTTGKEQYADGGSGKFITQGASDMIQSALFHAGLTVVNRRDPNILLGEQQWGIRDLSTLLPSDFYVSGSINSLDFIPGGGVEVELAGVGPRYRQSRILVGIDLAMTSAHNGRIVANSTIQKQFYTSESGFSAARFANDTLVYAQIGGSEREALHHTLRQVLSYATFDLMAQMLSEADAASCLDDVTASGRVIQDETPQKFGDGSVFEEALSAANLAEAETASAAIATSRAMPRGADAIQISAEARRLGNSTTSFAAKAIAAADAVLLAQTGAEATAAADKAVEAMGQAIQSLRAAAAEGLTGPEGDAAATLVEKAIVASQAAKTRAADMVNADAEAAEAGRELVNPTPASSGSASPLVPPGDRYRGRPEP